MSCPNPTPDSLAQGFSSSERNPHNFWLLKTREDCVWVSRRAAATLCALLKGLVCGLTHWKTHLLWTSAWGSSSKNTRIDGGNELSDFRARTGGEAFYQTEMLAETITSLLNPFPHYMQRQSDAISQSPSKWLTPFICPVPVVPEDQTPPNF